MTLAKATSTAHPRRNPGLSGAAAARHRGVPAHDRAAVRRPREVDQGARRGDALGHVHPARHAEERLRRRSGDRRDLRGRHARERAAAAEAARRHREGAGRGRAARARCCKYTDRSEYYEADAVVLEDDLGEKVEAEALARSVVTEFENYVKLNKKVSPEVVGVVQQIEDYAKLADTVASHLAVKIPDKQGILETHDRRRAAGEGARPDGERNLRPAGREAHPHARQAPDGEDAARVLPQRADEGDPEGAGRRGRQGRARRARGQDQEDQALEGSAREGARTS